MSALLPRPRKRFGQHFLIQPGIAERIVALGGVADQSVLEIGPGRGALTEQLAALAARLWLVELDRDLAGHWREHFAGQPSVHVIEDDILDVDLDTLLAPSAPVRVVANLPYNISTPVLMKLLGAPHLFSRLVLMLQREVAERVCAAPGSKSYGALSVMVQLVAAVRVALRVPPGAFQPPPKVESAVVVIEPRKPPPLDRLELARTRQVVRTAFGQRRKQLANSLAALGPDVGARLARLAIDPRRRAETLAPADFVRIAAALCSTERNP